MTSPTILAIDGRSDPLLHHVAPLGLAAAAGTALVVDLDPDSPGYGQGVTVAKLLEDGLRHDHLLPARSGIAVVSSGGAGLPEAADLIGALASRWPAVVVRSGSRPPSMPVVPVVPLYPEPLFRRRREPAVYQAMVGGTRPSGPGVVLPPLGRGRLLDLIGGTVDPRWRWVRAWRRVWELPWR